MWWASQLIAGLRGRLLLNDGLREGALEFIRLLPRITIGVIGSGFIAEVVPNSVIAPWLGPESGLLGVLIATVGGALTPGGPVVGFAIGAAALKSGAGAPQVIAYSTAWALYALNRLLIWEVPMMPAARGLAARHRVAAAAVHRRRPGDGDRPAVIFGCGKPEKRASRAKAAQFWHRRTRNPCCSAKSFAGAPLDPNQCVKANFRGQYYSELRRI